jgi:hypothetical protein
MPRGECQRHFESAPGLVEVGNLVLTHPALRPWFPRGNQGGQLAAFVVSVVLVGRARMPARRLSLSR